MSTGRLPNYLRMYRKRAGLSQGEVASLLGCRTGAKVSRYEKFRREPTLRTALTFEAIFKIPVRELFAGLSEAVGHETRKRARYLTRRLKVRHNPRTVERKQKALDVITAPPPEELHYEPVEDL